MADNMKWKTVRVWEPDEDGDRKANYKSDGTPNKQSFQNNERTYEQGRGDQKRTK